MKEVLVAPSILSADFARLGDEVLGVLADGADWIHVDVMDGHFVPNLTIGAPVVKSLRPVTSAFLDVHLMIENPERYLDDFIAAGADSLTIHVEATDDAAKVLKQIQSHGVKAGVTLKPGTALETIEPCLPVADLVLVMTVEPGFGGQAFMQDQVTKLDQLAALKAQHGYSYVLEVDGGINADTVKQCRNADVLVAGSFIFRAKDRKAAIQSLKQH